MINNCNIRYIDNLGWSEVFDWWLEIDWYCYILVLQYILIYALNKTRRIHSWWNNDIIVIQCGIDLSHWYLTVKLKGSYMVVIDLSIYLLDTHNIIVTVMQ